MTKPFRPKLSDPCFLAWYGYYRARGCEVKEAVDRAVLAWREVQRNGLEPGS
jgi:hypothetical protein